ncbi:MAG: DUF6465 family protein [Lachnospirales bacterium]
MKTNIYVENDNIQTLISNFEKEAKSIWRSKGRLVKDIETLNIYFKPDEKKVYCVYNEKETDTFEIN